MSWFEVQTGRKQAIRALHDGLRREPLTLISLRGDLVASAEWLLALAEADTGGAASLRATIVGGVIAHALPVWLSDGEDMGKTMAQLDRDLRRVERFLWPSGKPRPRPRRKSRKRPR
jgi:hypothetical protein